MILHIQHGTMLHAQTKREAVFAKNYHSVQQRNVQNPTHYRQCIAFI